MATGLDFISKAQARLGESLSTAAQQQAMLYPDHVRYTFDEIARATECLYLSAVTDIINGQLQYAIPYRPFRLEAICVNDGNGNVFPLKGITAEQADEQFYNWRSANSLQTYQGIPRFYVDDGTTSYSLLPIPNYNVQDGLIVAGYYGVDDWYDMAADMPLPESVKECALLGICMRRCEEMAAQDDKYSKLEPMYERKYTAKRRTAVAEAQGNSEARRNMIPSRGSRMGAFGTWGLYVGS